MTAKELLARFLKGPVIIFGIPTATFALRE